MFVQDDMVAVIPLCFQGHGGVRREMGGVANDGTRGRSYRLGLSSLYVSKRNQFYKRNYSYGAVVLKKDQYRFA